MPVVTGVVVCHPKDFDTLGTTLETVRRCAPQLGALVVISPVDPGAALLGRSNLLGPGPRGSTARVSGGAGGGAAIWFDEARFPFRLADFAGCLPSPGWVLQQMLKLYAPAVLGSDAADPVLGAGAAGPDAFFVVVDADTVWLQVRARWLSLVTASAALKPPLFFLILIATGA